jgi:NAD(P)-dependent dehydrogenase (short-subunit alcohol dehydrogenase family)
VTIPALAVYCASKYALEAIADANRYELLPFGVDSILVDRESTERASTIAGSIRRIPHGSPITGARPNSRNESIASSREF